MLNFKKYFERLATYLSLKYFALATAWIDAGTKGNPRKINYRHQISYYLRTCSMLVGKEPVKHTTQFTKE